jgi:hypothetical protein
MARSNNKQAIEARRLFKLLKAGLKKPEDFNFAEINLLSKFYPFLFK